jgi:FkbM family methyltransferase
MSSIVETLRKSRLAMLIRKPWRRVFRRIEDSGLTPDNPLWFTRFSRGVIHVGAHAGQEAWIYGLFKKPVLWFEPIPEVFAKLKENIRRYPRQEAIQSLVTDVDGAEFQFNVSNCNGGSSSVFELGGHKEMYPGVEYVDKLTLRSVSLDSALATRKGAQPYNCLVMDVQGAELLVLKGAINTLPKIDWIFAECADFEIYENGCTYSDLKSFLEPKGFKEEKKFLKESREGLGTTYDVLFKRGL